MTELDRWIYTALDKAVRDARTALENYRYNDAASSVYEYFWNNFCDWYVEATKLSFKNGDEAEKNRTVSVLLNVLEESLRLLHPFIPFVTEEIYSKLPLKEILENRAKSGVQKILPNENYDGLLTTAPYPEQNDFRADAKITARFAVLQELIRSVRALRNECGIEAAAKIRIALKIVAGSDAEVCREKVEMICLLAGLSSVEFVDGNAKTSIGTVGTGFEAFILLDEGIDRDSLKKRFEKDIARLQNDIQRIEAKLSGKFAQHAPKELVDAEKEKLLEAQRRIEKLNGYIADL